MQRWQVTIGDPTGTGQCKRQHVHPLQGSTHMLGPGNVVHQLRMQGPGAERAPQRSCKGLLRRCPHNEQVWYLSNSMAFSTTSDLTFPRPAVPFPRQGAQAAHQFGINEGKLWEDGP